MESSFALLEATAMEYDKLGVVRQPAGTRLKGIAPSNIFRSRDNLWMVIAANQDNVFRRLCPAIGRPELADDPRFVTHEVRGENQDEIDGIVADWAARHSAAEIDRILNDAGVVCGPVYTIAEIFEDPQYRARDSTTTRRSGDWSGPGSSPGSRRRPARCAGPAPARKAATTRRSTAACWACRRRSSVS